MLLYLLTYLFIFDITGDYCISTSTSLCLSVSVCLSLCRLITIYHLSLCVIFGQAPSSRRSHDGGYGGGDGYGNAGRYESSQGGGAGGYSDRRSSFNDDRRSTFRPPRDDYRKPVSTAPSTTTRASPRGSGSYRGRVSSRGTRGNRLSIREGLVRRRVVDTASYLRKRGTTIRSSTTDYLRRLRINRIRR